MGVVSLENEYYPLVKGDREGRRGPRTKPGDSNIKRAERGGRTYMGKRRGKQGERRKTRGGYQPQGQESSVLRGKWCGGD